MTPDASNTPPPHKKKNVVVTLSAGLVRRMNDAVGNGDFSSFSDIIQTLVSEYVGKLMAYRDLNLDFQEIRLRKSPRDNLVRLTVSLNEHVAGELKYLSGICHESVSEVASSVLYLHFLPNDLSERPLDDDSKKERFIVINENDVDEFVLNYVKNALGGKKAGRKGTKRREETEGKEAAGGTEAADGKKASEGRSG